MIRRLLLVPAMLLGFRPSSAADLKTVAAEARADRPELLERATLSEEDRRMVGELGADKSESS